MKGVKGLKGDRESVGKSRVFKGSPAGKEGAGGPAKRNSKEDAGKGATGDNKAGEKRDRNWEGIEAGHVLRTPARREK